MFRKVPTHWLLINQNEKWELILCSVEDVVEIKKGLLNVGPSPDRKFYLLRATDKLKVEASTEMDPFPEDPNAKKLLAQALFFAGDFHALSKRNWVHIIEENLLKGDLRKIYQLFFEEKILQYELIDDYKSSQFYQILLK